MAKDPAFLFYYSDFLVGTDEMSNEAVGAYIRCLCHQAHKGFITESHMLKICNSHDIHNEIKNKFISEDNGTTYFNKRLRLEVEKRQKYSESRANNRKKTNSNHFKEDNISKSYVNHMENENTIENEIIIEEEEKGVTEEKGVSNKKTEEAIDYDSALNFFNGVRNKMPEVRSITPNRKKALQAIIKEYGKIKVGNVFKMAGESDFLNGDNKKGWVASFDWLLKPNNFIKVMEGNYKNNSTPKNNNSGFSDAYKKNVVDRFLSNSHNPLKVQPVEEYGIL